MALHKQHAVYRGRCRRPAAGAASSRVRRRRAAGSSRTVSECRSATIYRQVVVVLQQRPVAHRAHIVAQRGRAGGLDAGQNALAFGLRLRGLAGLVVLDRFGHGRTLLLHLGGGTKKTAPVQWGTAPAPRAGDAAPSQNLYKDRENFLRYHLVCRKNCGRSVRARMPGIRGPGPGNGGCRRRIPGRMCRPFPAALCEPFVRLFPARFPAAPWLSVGACTVLLSRQRFGRCAQYGAHRIQVFKHKRGRVVKGRALRLLCGCVTFIYIISYL